MKLLLAVVALVALIHQCRSLHCYFCTNDYNQPYPYDPNCGDPDYANPNFIQNFRDPTVGNCYTELDGNGIVMRNAASGHLDGECDLIEKYTQCFCKGDVCNTSLCEICDP
ncbi:unnamed protein product [Meganyctiphanes norvegica]|uniref:Protein sleepless n=1 Tax=Meganyctiphanes norvegica TaxID=48144 RepID=A0AAV2SEL5_MEGNR